MKRNSYYHRLPVRKGSIKRPTYIAKFEGGELDGRTQPMYGKGRLKPREVIEMGAWYNMHEPFYAFRKVDYYVCLNPAKRIETLGETRIYRYEPNHTLGLEAA